MVPTMEESEKRDLLSSLIRELCDERGDAAPLSFADYDTDQMWRIFRGLVNTREPYEPSEQLIERQDRLLKGLIAEKGVVSLEDTRPAPPDGTLRLYKGDITLLATDAIVNAANSQMLGCWVPGHNCIDNAIHTFAGVQLRVALAKIMAAQGTEEPTGSAKVTDAYNLPSRHIIHTVGPVADGYPTDADRKSLASCYTSCLDAAVQSGDASIAFCCISTGVFGFPKDEAARIAVDTTKRWLSEHGNSGLTVVFNVFGDDDEARYEELLGL
jgi:O-acetyl-ADP-ribose deacetylase (regulator of RNase III)